MTVRRRPAPRRRRRQFRQRASTAAPDPSVSCSSTLAPESTAPRWAAPRSRARRPGAPPAPRPRRPPPHPRRSRARPNARRAAPGTVRLAVTARESNSTVPVTRSPRRLRPRRRPARRRRCGRSGPASGRSRAVPRGLAARGQFVAVVERAASGRGSSGPPRALARRPARRRRLSPSGRRSRSPPGDHRSRRPPRPRHGRAPATIAAPMSAGSSSRGLSSVTTTQVGQFGGGLSPSAPACRGRGCRLRRTPRRCGPSLRTQRLQDRAQCAGLVGVVDEGEEALPAVDRLQPAGHGRRSAVPVPPAPATPRPRRAAPAASRPLATL